MEIKGKIIAILPVQTGQGKNGMWRNQDAVIETDGQYPKKICFNLWGDKIDQYPMQIGQKVNVSFDIDSKEYNGKWFTKVVAWKVDVEGATQPVPTKGNGTIDEGTGLPF